MKEITEEMKAHEAWYEEAKKQTVETLPEFVKKLTTEYQHDYGTICHACAAAACAAVWAVNHSDQGGITGFQAGAIMWEFLKHFNHIDGPARILQYEDMIYPQSAGKFNQISPAAWEAVKLKAKQTLLSNDMMHPDVREHMERVANGEVPFGYTLSKGQ